MFRPYVLAIIRLSLNLSSSYTNAGSSGGVGGFGGRDFVFIIVDGIPLNIMANMPPTINPLVLEFFLNFSTPCI